MNIECEPEEIEFHGWRASCRHCSGHVFMPRDTRSFALQLDRCFCAGCGQRYYVRVKGSLKEFELGQWREKSERGSC